MKKKLVLLTTLVVTLNAFTQNTNLILASDVWPPFTNKPNKQSLALDLVNEALARDQVTVQQQIMPFESVLKHIKDNAVDGSAALWKTPEREKDLIFSKPFLENQLILIGLKGRDVTLKSIAELTKSKVGVVANYAYDKALLQADNLKLVYSANDQENLEKLFDKKIEYMLVDALLIQYLLKYQFTEVQTYLSIADTPFEIKRLHFAIRKDVPNSKEIISDFNKRIEEMILDGTYNHILDLDGIQVDTNGDGTVELVLNTNNLSENVPKKIYNIFYNPNIGSSQIQYRLDGKIYTSWDNVPKPTQSSGIHVTDDIYNTGLRININ